jgi:plasmid stabilization system protein ParE
LICRVRFTRSADDDLLRFFGFIGERVPTDIGTAERALDSIRGALSMLERFPFSCRKVSSESPFLREITIPFGADGYVALFEIEDARTVTVLAVRRQREDDYR